MAIVGRVGRAVGGVDSKAASRLCKAAAKAILGEELGASFLKSRCEKKGELAHGRRLKQRVAASS